MGWPRWPALALFLKNKNPDVKVEYAFEDKTTESKAETLAEGENREAVPPQSFEYIPS
jgi:hypothetical protein